MKHTVTVFYNGRRQNYVTLNDLPNFNKGVLRFGRGMDNDIILPYPTVSRHHGELRVLGDSVKIVDTGSLNRITVNGAYVSEAVLLNGTEAVIGPGHGAPGAVVLRYTAEDEPVADGYRETQVSQSAMAVKPRLIAVKQAEPPQLRKAGVIERAIAGAIDYIVWFLIWIGLLTASAIMHVPLGMPLGISAAVAVGWLYFACMESSERQATLGKIIMGLTVISSDGERLTFAKATKRFFYKLLSTAILGLGLLPLFGGRTLHDRASGCKVVKFNIRY